MRVRQKTRRAWQLGAVASAICTLSLLGLSGVHSNSADAAINSKIDVKVTELVNYTTDDRTDGDRVYKGEMTRMSFTWDASQANPQPGDQFSIELPDHFANRDYPIERDLTFEGISAGKCSVEKQTMTCTLGDAIAGKQNIRGTGEAILSVVTAYNKTTSDIIINGKKQVVPNPGNAPIGEGRPATPWTPSTPYKYVDVLKENSTSLRWNVGFSAKVVKDWLGSSSVPNQITFTDKLGTGQKYADRVAYLYVTKTKNDTTMDWVLVAQSEGGQVKNRFGDFTLTRTLNADKTQATFTMTGPFSEDANYVLEYDTVPTTENGKVMPGFEYSNEAKLQGSEEKILAHRMYVDSFVVTIQMEDGFGSFKVTKLLDGEGVNQVPVDTEYTVKADWTLPAGKTAADYPGWNAPANPVLLTVKAGKIIQAPATFPEGTRISLSEDQTKTQVPASVTWQKPVFTISGSSQGGETASFTIRNQENTDVSLTNTFTVKKGTFEIVKGSYDVTKKELIPTRGDNAVESKKAAVNDSVSQSNTADPKSDNPPKAPFVNKEFVFDYQCSEGTSGKVTVKVEGENAGYGYAQSNVYLPIGTTCTIKEDVSQAQVEGYTLKAPQPQTITIDSEGEEGAVLAYFLNEYTPVPPTPTPSPLVTPTPEVPSPTPSVTPTPEVPSATTPAETPSPSSTTPQAAKKTELPRTGASVSRILLASIAVLLISGAIMIATRHTASRKK